MGCNCKKKINRKYTDGRDNGMEKRSAVGVFFYKIMNIFLYLLVTVFALALTPFAVCFVIYKGFFGKKAIIKLPFADKFKNIKKNE